MPERDSDFPDGRAQALARLATLQRLREQALQENRTGMLKSIEQLMEQERKALDFERDAELGTASYAKHARRS
jgi:hypothetical protein